MEVFAGSMASHLRERSHLDRAVTPSAKAGSECPAFVLSLFRERIS
jgi:hypothetical protein